MVVDFDLLGLDIVACDCGCVFVGDLYLGCFGCCFELFDCVAWFVCIGSWLCGVFGLCVIVGVVVALLCWLTVETALFGCFVGVSIPFVFFWLLSWLLVGMGFACCLVYYG